MEIKIGDKIDLKCPLCDGENVHPEKPEFQGEYDTSCADYSIIIPFWCECNCKGKFIIHHHEGYTYLSVEKI